MIDQYWNHIDPCCQCLLFRMPIHAHLRICGDTLYSLMISHNICKHSYWQLLLTYIDIYKHHPTLFYHVLSTYIQSYYPNKKQQKKQHQLSADEDQGTRVPSARDRQDEIAQHHDGFQSDQKFPSEAPFQKIEVRPVIVVEPTKNGWVSY